MTQPRITPNPDGVGWLVITDPPQGPFETLAQAQAVFDQAVLCESIALTVRNERARCAAWVRALADPQSAERIAYHIENGTVR